MKEGHIVYNGKTTAIILEYPKPGYGYIECVPGVYTKYIVNI